MFPAIDSPTFQNFFESFVNRTDAFYIAASSGLLAKREILTLQHVQRHLRGVISIGLPATDALGYCKWICFDDDSILPPAAAGYLDAIEAKLTQSGINTLREGARPVDGGLKQGHLWVLFQEKIEAKYARAWARNVMCEAGVPLDNKTFEVFPKSDVPASLGSNLKLPLGYHNKVKDLRCFFDGGPDDLHGQLQWLADQPLNPIEKVREQGDWQLQLEAARSRYSRLNVSRLVSPTQGKCGSVLEAVAASGGRLKRSGGEWSSTRCPLCELEGHDHAGTNLAIHKSGAFKCFAGHAGREIYRHYFGSGGVAR